MYYSGEDPISPSAQPQWVGKHAARGRSGVASTPVPRPSAAVWNCGWCGPARSPCHQTKARTKGVSHLAPAVSRYCVVTCKAVADQANIAYCISEVGAGALPMSSPGSSWGAHPRGVPPGLKDEERNRSAAAVAFLACVRPSARPHYERSRGGEACRLRTSSRPRSPRCPRGVRFRTLRGDWISARRARRSKSA